MMLIPPPKGKPSDRVYTTLPFVPIMKTTQEGPPPPLPLVPIEGQTLPVWGESLMYEAYDVWNLWRESTTMLYLHGAPDQRDPYDTTDGLDLTDGDRYLGRRDKQYLPTAPVTSRATYMSPSDGAWSRSAAPNNEHNTPRGEQAMTDDTANPTPKPMPLITITDGITLPTERKGWEYNTLPVNTEEGSYEDDALDVITSTMMGNPPTEGPAPLTTYLEYLSTIKAVYTTLKANGTHKQAGIALAVLSANWLGDMLYHMVPFSGVPMTVGMLCLSSLLLRSNREKLVRALKEYVE